MTATTRSEHAHDMLSNGHDLFHGQFKRHKVLPRPKNEQTVDVNRALVIDAHASTEYPTVQTSSPRILKHQPRRIGTGPDLPPTPPNHSRVSSGSHPTQPSSPSYRDHGVHTPQTASRRHPVTPPDQRSPPTPDVTPPQPASRPHARRSAVSSRNSSRTVTNTDTRTESFETAREDPSPFQSEAATPTKQQTGVTYSTLLQTTSLQCPISTASSEPVHPQALDLALERLRLNAEETYTPREYRGAIHLDDKWRSPRYTEMEQDVDLQRLVSTGSPRPKFVSPTTSQHDGTKNEALGDKLVSRKKAIQTVRNTSLKEVGSVELSPISSSASTSQQRGSGLDASRSEAFSTTKSRRCSGLSNHSMSSTVVEAILINDSSPPQRQRTLRHVRKRRELREPSPHGTQGAAVDRDFPPVANSALPTSRGGNARRHDSYVSATSSNSAASGKARREVWKAGAIPVIVIPDRRSSCQSKSRVPSLRSSSSRHSRTRSAGFPPLSQSSPSGEELSFRRHRSTSVSDLRDQRTMHFAPTVPPRSSSLSASLSRATSRTTSFTSGTMKALNELNQQNINRIKLETAPSATTTTTTTTTTTIGTTAAAEPSARKNSDSVIHTNSQIKATIPALQIANSPVIARQSPWTPQSDWSWGHDLLDADHHDDAVSTKKYSSRNTPFSIISMETIRTAPEVSEAQAVRMYPHQNSSVLRINHYAKPQDMKYAMGKISKQPGSHIPPKITTTCPEEGTMTPEERRSWGGVDSPLRHPRLPPNPPICPPAINFIPATPSGLTPAEERQVQLGNFYEIAAETPVRRPSAVRRALNRRRHSISYPLTSLKQAGFLSRTFSISRNGHKSIHIEKPSSLLLDMESDLGRKENKPAEEDKLHPHWRPQRENNTGDCDCPSCHRDSVDEEEIYRYALAGNLPRLAKRSLAAKVKNTFSILPARQDYSFYLDDVHGPERRTIRRTPSGNLKVMRRRSSDYSLRQQAKKPQEERRPSSEGSFENGYWRSHRLRRRRSNIGARGYSSLGSIRFEKVSSLKRRWNEKRREKRARKLRQVISGPRDVRDGVGEVVRLRNMKNQQAGYSC